MVKLCYPQFVDKSVDNFCKPVKTLLKRHRTEPVQPQTGQAFSPCGDFVNRKEKISVYKQEKESFALLCSTALSR